MAMSVIRAPSEGEQKGSGTYSGTTPRRNDAHNISPALDGSVLFGRSRAARNVLILEIMLFVLHSGSCFGQPDALSTVRSRTK